MILNKKIAPETQKAEPLKIGKPGPFEIIESDVPANFDNPLNAPRRRYDCSNYEDCLIIAAGLNWYSFTCRGCCGEFQESLQWRARQEINKDKTAKKICDMPKACINSNGTRKSEGPHLKLVNKQKKK